MSKRSLGSQLRGRWVPAGLAAGFFSLFAWFGLVVQANYREPGAAPPGGRSGVWLDTGANPQIKIGSLLIGDGAGNDQLCLNSNLDDAERCLTSWSTFAGLTDEFVRVYYKRLDEYVQDADPAVPGDYESLAQRGYVYLRGNDGAFGNFTYGSDAIFQTGAVGIYAGDGSNGIDPSVNFGGYAARFDGRVRITPDAAGSSGHLCLNGSQGYPEENSVTGCIDAWSDLGGYIPGVYIKRQASNPPAELQFGTGWLTPDDTDKLGAWQFSSVVVGGAATVPSVPSVGYYNGDGLCSPEIGEAPPLSDCQSPP